MSETGLPEEPLQPESWPPLREVVDGLGLFAKKSLGQHFLFDLNLTRRIARAAGPLGDMPVIEIGPGPGGLTRALILEGARRLILIEKDARFAPALTSLAGPERLRLVEGDALTADEAALLAEEGAATARVAANLPYNVGTALLVKWLTGPAWWASLTLMFQKEVAQRIVARPGQSAYGRLAVLAAAASRPEYLFTVPARAFTPPPKVESAVVRLEPLSAAERYGDLEGLAQVTAAAFGQRRKMMRAATKPLFGGEAEAALMEAGIDPAARAETLEPAAFQRLTDIWRGRGA